MNEEIDLDKENDLMKIKEFIGNEFFKDNEESIIKLYDRLINQYDSFISFDQIREYIQISIDIKNI
jgi:hypothetical protein